MRYFFVKMPMKKLIASHGRPLYGLFVSAIYINILCLSCYFKKNNSTNRADVKLK